MVSPETDIEESDVAKRNMILGTHLLGWNSSALGDFVSRFDDLASKAGLEEGSTDEQEPDDCQWSHVISWQHGSVPDPVGRSLRGFPDWVVNSTPRPSTNRVTFCNWKYFTKDTPLLDSGLIGPVRIRFGQKFSLTADEN